MKIKGQKTVIYCWKLLYGGKFPTIQNAVFSKTKTSRNWKLEKDLFDDVTVSSGVQKEVQLGTRTIVKFQHLSSPRHHFHHLDRLVIKIASCL